MNEAILAFHYQCFGLRHKMHPASFCMYFDVNERNLKLSGGVWSSLPSCADLSDDNNCVRIGLVPTTQPPPTSGNT